MAPTNRLETRPNVPPRSGELRSSWSRFYGPLSPKRHRRDSRGGPSLGSSETGQNSGVTGRLQAAHIGQELAVRLGLAELVDQQFHGFDRGQWVQDFAQDPDPGQVFFRDQKREPVSISAVAIMVSEPPSSMLRAEPKKRLGRCRAFESTPPESTLPLGGTMVL
jgi:hypothetical protein